MADENKSKRKRTYLDVPFKERDAAQALGALSDRRTKRLFVPGGTDVAAFAKWLPKQDPQQAKPSADAQRVRNAPRAAEREALLGSDDDFEREAVRLSELMGQPIEQSREFVRDRVRAAEEAAALETRDRFLRTVSAFEVVDKVQEAVRQARHQFFAERQHLYEPSTTGDSVEQAPAADAQAKLDDAALGRRYREAIQSIAASATLRGDEVSRTLALDQRLETIHRDAWRKSGDAADGDRAIGEQIRTRSGFAAEHLPPQAIEALNKLHTEADLSPIEVEARTLSVDLTDADLPDDAPVTDSVSVAPTHQHRHREPDPVASAVTFADVADAFELEEARRAQEPSDGADQALADEDRNVILADLSPAQSSEPDTKPDEKPAVQANADAVTFADVGEAAAIDDAMRRRGLTENAAPGVSHGVDASTVKAGAANEAVAQPGKAANDQSDAPVLDGSPGPAIRDHNSPAQNEADAKNPANEPTRPVLDTVSEQDLKRLGTLRAGDRAAAEALLREQNKPMPKVDAPAEGPADASAAGDNQIDVDPASRKPIVKKDGYDVPTQVASRYMVKEGRFWKLDGTEFKPSTAPTTKPHFEDVGARLKTQQNDRATIADMLAIAEAKNWDSIVVRGDETFRRNAWIEASLSGADMSRFKGFKPKESDEALLEVAKRERAALTIKAGKSPETSAEQKQELTANMPEAVGARAAKPDAKAAPANPSTSGTSADSAADPTAKPVDALSGELLEHGAARYQHKADASYSYFVRYRVSAGDEQTVWGVDLKRAMSESGAKVGDTVSLKNLGETPVTVDEPVRDASGKVIGTQPKEAIRNTWEVQRVARPEPEPAQAKPERMPLTVEQMREQLARTIEKLPARTRTELLNRFDARIQAGTEIEARISRGELSRDAGAAEIDKRAAELHAAWTAPKAAPKSSPSNTPQAEQQPTRGPMPNLM
ncbi:hypothetical protein C0Z18_26660 [Trinickia dabaoshanensis]|uniref:Large polyvalent protein-associated domain-containing protein n=1 Tax=Trinickia dabaoshanensis TaxID=564714 RepID=A0A2N7VEM1_9BURK|nr:LPD7 domain-containing protein [Trinickia dabaoshanensis]PMS15602.1 hypothetical protein C0Z18_26660 [Trinickia dabaoshanensis]